MHVSRSEIAKRMHIHDFRHFHADVKYFTQYLPKAHCGLHSVIYCKQYTGLMFSLTIPNFRILY